MRERRNNISNQEYLHAAKNCAEIIITNKLLDNCQKIALYLSQDNELDLYLLLEHCLKLKKECYLPVLNNNKLDFAIYNHSSTLQTNRYNIPEPVMDNKHSSKISAKELDLVFLPLVAFTKTGQRLGMGGGYYDQTFAFLANSSNNDNNSNNNILKPKLIGVAYDLQCMDQLPADSWDINLNGIITESAYIKI